MFNFDLSILPIKLNLPMVCEPVPWQSESPAAKLDELEGGYLGRFTAEFYNRFRLLTSRDYSHFYIKLHSQSKLCMNRLQSQAFGINAKVFYFIKENRETLEDVGLLINRRLAHANLEEASKLLRFCYFNDEAVKEVCSFHVLLTELIKRVQQARYEEDFEITLAGAHQKSKFYRPAFMDLRGRIYRSGVLHFHERDLAKSLLQFVYNTRKQTLQSNGPLSKTPISMCCSQKKTSLYELELLPSIGTRTFTKDDGILA